MLIYLAAFAIFLLMVYRFGTATSKAVINFKGGGNAKLQKEISDKELTNTKEIFLKTVFSLLGYIAKSDGSVNNIEIKLTEDYMNKLSLNAELKRRAIQLFKQGSQPDFNASNIIKEFSHLSKKNPDQTEILLVYLVNLARMDGLIVDKELKSIDKVADGLGFNSIAFNQLLRMISSQNKFADSQPQTSNTSSRSSSSNNKFKQSEQKSKSQEQKPAQDDRLIAAYEALGLLPTASDEELKITYRRLANKYHPDKLQGQGVPDFMIKSTSDCFKKIQTAYAYIKQSKS